MSAISRIYTRDFKGLKKSGVVALVIAIISLAVSLVALYKTYTNQNINSPNFLTKQQDCTKNGLTAVQLYKNDNKVETIDSPNFHYNKNSGKCYAYLEVAPYQLCESGRIVFDVGENKEVLTACFKATGDINYVDSTKYPREIIDQLKFTQIKNSLLEIK